LPIRYLGIGERVEDFEEFNAKIFIEAILN